MDSEKPVCGGGEDPGDYDVGIHVAGLFLVLGASIFGAGFPVAAKRVKWLKMPARVLFACKHFGTGVLIATAFVHLLPTAFFSLSDPCLPDFFTVLYPPITGVIMMIALFALFVMEMWLNGKTGGHSHGGPTGVVVVSDPPVRPSRRYSAFSFEADTDINAEKKMAQDMYRERQREKAGGLGGSVDDLDDSGMPSWFLIFYEQYVRQRIEMMNLVRQASGGGGSGDGNELDASHKVRNDHEHEHEHKRGRHDLEIGEVRPQDSVPDGWFLDREGNWTDPAVYRKQSLNITLLEGGILFHSVFVGMTVSLTVEGFIVLLVAILFHQMFEGLGLGSRIAAVPYPRASIRPWLLVVAFGTTAPIGQAIGLGARGIYDPNSAIGLIIVGIFNAISSGLLIYAALVDLLAEDFLSEEANRVLSARGKIHAFLYVLLGALGMSIVGAFA